MQHSGNRFDPALGRLEIILPLPPSDNKCHRSGAYSRYAAAPYRDWLDIAREQLLALLGEWQPDAPTRNASGKVVDAGTWWRVDGELFLGVRPGDGPNYIKPALDMLSGSYVARAGDRDEAGDQISIGKILKRRGFWDDDNRVQVGSWRVVGLRHPEPYLRLVVQPEESAPADCAPTKKRSKR